MEPGGKQRGPGEVILLSIVTQLFAFGAYWFYWIYKAFQEVADARGKPLPRKAWLIPLIVLYEVFWIASVVRGIMLALERYKRVGAGGVPPAFDPAFFLDPWALAIGAVGALFYSLQAFYLHSATNLVVDATKERGVSEPPNPKMAVLFCALFAAGAVPFAGSLARLGGIVIAIVWVLQVQKAMNEYWSAGQAPPSPLPPMQIPGLARPPPLEPASPAPYFLRDGEEPPRSPASKPAAAPAKPAKAGSKRKAPARKPTKPAAKPRKKK